MFTGGFRRVFSTLALSFAALLTSLLLFQESRQLSEQEQQQLLEGKKIWVWDSPYGPLATHYEEMGQGDRHLFLIHGFRANTFTWRHLIQPLADAGYHVWAIDLIGYGLSAKPSHIPYGIDFFTEHMHAFMADHQIESCCLMGNSMGGGLALNFACSHPEQSACLVLINPLGYPIDIPFYIEATKHWQPIWIPFLVPSVIRLSLYQIVFDPASVSEEQVHAYSLPYRLQGGALATLLTLQNYSNERVLEISKKYPSIQHPALLIWGENDQLLPLKHFERFCRDLPKVESFLIPSCGHIPHEEQPQTVLASILSFLQTAFPAKQSLGDTL